MSDDEWRIAVFTLDLPRIFSGIQRQSSADIAEEGTSVELRDRSALVILAGAGGDFA
jgi:hypothetical protein